MKYYLFTIKSNFLCLFHLEKPRVPHVFIIYQDGLHTDFSTEISISPPKNFFIKLPTSKSYLVGGIIAFDTVQALSGYLSYANLDKIYIFYIDGSKNLTYIDIKTQKHRTISGTNFGNPLYFASGVRVGKNFFMATDRSNYGLNLPQRSWKTQSYIWMDKREQLFNHSLTFATSYKQVCFASFNRLFS